MVVSVVRCVSSHFGAGSFCDVFSDLCFLIPLWSDLITFSVPLDRMKNIALRDVSHL